MPLFPIKFYEKNTIPLINIQIVLLFFYGRLSAIVTLIINIAVVIQRRLHSLSCLKD